MKKNNAKDNLFVWNIVDVASRQLHNFISNLQKDLTNSLRKKYQGEKAKFHTTIDGNPTSIVDFCCHETEILDIKAERDVDDKQKFYYFKILVTFMSNSIPSTKIEMYLDMDTPIKLL